MLHSPQRISPSRSTGPCSSQSRSYSRTAWSPPPRSTRFEPAGGRQELGERRRQGRRGRRARGGCSRRRRDAARARSGRICVADQTALRVRDCSRRRGTRAPPPRSTQPSPRARPAAADARRRRRAAAPSRSRCRGDEPVEDRLDLVGGGVPGRAQAVAGDGVALLAQLRLAEPSPVELDHLGAEHVAAEPRVRRRVVAAQQMVHVQRGRRGSRARRARARGRSSRLRRRRDSRPRRPARSGHAGGCALRSVRAPPRLHGADSAAKR